MSIQPTFLTPELVIPEPEQIRRAKENMSAAVREKKLEAAQVKQAWKEQRTAEMRGHQRRPADQIDAILERALTKGELCGDYELHICRQGQAVPEIVRVRDVLAKPGQYDGCLTLDPLEPDYAGARSVGKLFLDDVPTLHTMARGGRTYRLFERLDDTGRDPLILNWDAGRSAEIVSSCIEKLASTGCFYSLGDFACRVEGARTRVLTEPLIDFELSRIIRLRKPGRNGESTEMAMPQRLVKQILAQAASQLPPLEAIIDHPLPRPDGGLIDRAGYDPETALYLRKDPDLFPVPDNPTPHQIAKSVQTCLAPFAHYRFLSAQEGRAAVLAAVMTAVLRPAFPVAPLIAISSPSSGAGKGFLAAAIGVIATGEIPGCSNLPKSEEELEKRLFSYLVAGHRIINIDNADRTLHSDALSSFTTSAWYSGRHLGVSVIDPRLPNRTLIIINGRNLGFGDGLARRHIPIRLSAVGGGDLTRTYGFLPSQLARETRDEIIAAVLTLTRVKAHDQIRAQSFASFGDWSRMVRDPIAMIAHTYPEHDLVDPLDFLLFGIRDDAQSAGHAELLDYITKQRLAEEFTSAELGELSLRDPVWADLVKSVVPHGKHDTVQGIGQILVRIADQPVNGQVLRYRKRDGVNVWRIDAHAQDAPAPN